MPLAEIAATAEMLYYFDEDIINAFDRHSGETIYDQLIKTGEDMEPMVQIEKMNPYCIAGFVFGYVINSPKLQTASLQIIESQAIASGYKTIIRELIGRARPSENLDPRYFKFLTGESFPSGYTSNACQVATILSHHVNSLPFSFAAFGAATTV